jgi:hypothetical protein
MCHETEATRNLTFFIPKVLEKELHVCIIAVTYRSYTTTKVGESLEQAIEVEEEEVKDEDEFPQKFQEEIENLLKDDTSYFPAPHSFSI